jgi:hypothetical protein
MPKLKTTSVFAVHYTRKMDGTPAKMDVTAMSPDEARNLFFAKVGKGTALVSKVKFLRPAEAEDAYRPYPPLKPHEIAIHGA